MHKVPTEGKTVAVMRALRGMQLTDEETMSIGLACLAKLGLPAIEMRLIRDLIGSSVETPLPDWAFDAPADCEFYASPADESEVGDCIDCGHGRLEHRAIVAHR